MARRRCIVLKYSKDDRYHGNDTQNIASSPSNISVHSDDLDISRVVTHDHVSHAGERSRRANQYFLIFCIFLALSCSRLEDCTSLIAEKQYEVLAIDEVCFLRGRRGG